MALATIVTKQQLEKPRICLGWGYWSMVFSLGSFKIAFKTRLSWESWDRGSGKTIACIELELVFSSHEVSVLQGKTLEIHS